MSQRSAWARKCNTDSFDIFVKSVESSVFEKLYLNLAQCVLHKKTVNLGVRGELGLYPIMFEIVKTFLKYERKIENVYSGLIADAVIENSYLELQNLRTGHFYAREHGLLTKKSNYDATEIQYRAKFRGDF